MSVPTTPWIINKQQDLTWFSGSALLGYALITFAFLAGGLPGGFLVLYAFMVDGPHVFSTLTRALFDEKERLRLRSLWLIAFPLCVTGILLLAMFAGADAAFVLVAVLSRYHISKQHMGFVMIYKRKAGERDDFKIDKYFTLVSLILPLGYYLAELLVPGRLPLLVFLIPGVVLAIGYAWHQRDRELNGPKLLLLAAFIPLQWLAWGFAAMEPHSVSRLVAAGVALNVGHSFQYLRLMYFHNHNRYSDQTGINGFINRKAIYFFAAVVLLALPNFLSTQINTQYLSAFVVGMLLFHFILDAKIWRIRGDKELAHALRL